MKVTAFNGSPRKNGNTQLLINKTLETIQKHGIETELVQVGGNLLWGCQSCYACFKTRNGRCRIEEDQMNEFIEKVHSSDAIIFASPTYYGEVSAEMKAFIDRLGLTSIGAGRTLTHKIGAALVSVRRSGAVPVYDSLNRFMLGSGMIVVGSTHWNAAIGEMPGDIYQDEEGMHNAVDLGEQLVWTLKVHAAAKIEQTHTMQSSFSNYYK
ncbi:MAG: flavodoxin family protein [Phocaeicola sp.]